MSTSSDDVDSDAGCSFNFPPREPEKNAGDSAQQARKLGYPSLASSSKKAKRSPTASPIDGVNTLLAQQEELYSLIRKVIDSFANKQKSAEISRKENREMFFIDQINILCEQICQLEEKHHQTGDAFYEMQINRKRKQIEQLENKKNRAYSSSST